MIRTMEYLLKIKKYFIRSEICCSLGFQQQSEQTRPVHLPPLYAYPAKAV